MQATARPASVTVARKELHQLVWATPIPKVAAALGIRPKRLIKICEELDIPLPTKWYWKRKRANQTAVVLQLPAKKESTPEKVIISTASGARTRRLENPRLSLAKRKTIPFSDTNSHGGVHPIIGEWHRNRTRLRKTFSLRNWSECELRAHNVLGSIFRALELGGLVVEARERPSTFCVLYKGVKIDCNVREKKKRERETNTNSGRIWGDLKPSGNLVFEIENSFTVAFSERRLWTETEGRRLDDLIEEIVSSIFKAGPVLCEQYREQEERAQKSREAERLRQLEEELRHIDAKRWAAFIKYAERLEISVRTRKLIANVDLLAGDLSTVVEDRTIAQWIEWAKDHVQELDPLSDGVEALFNAIAKQT